MASSENPTGVRILPELAVLFTLLVYLPLGNNQFVNWDDPNYLQFNPHIRNLNFASLQWMFSHFQVGYWIPLTWLSFALDFAIGRLEPWVYHLDNLILHLLNTFLVFGISLKILTQIESKLKQPPPHWAALAAFGTALLFGIHPLHVESVAWATERKDLLCGLFSLLSLRAYLGYASETRSRRRNYAACLLFLIFSLLAKPMAVSLPFVFLLLDFWPLEKNVAKDKKLWLEKIPFFLTVLLFSGLAVWTQLKSGAGWGLNESPLSFRLMNACHSLVFYLFKMIVPVHLTAFYPILIKDTFSLDYQASALFVLFISVICFLNRQKRPSLSAAWLYYILSLAPVLGLLQVGNQAAADRFTYLPSLSPFLLAASALVYFLSRRKSLLFMAAIAATLLLSYGTVRQISVWKDSISLWENVLSVYPNNNLIVHNNLGKAYEASGRYDEALVKFQDADVPGIPFFYSHWGKARILAQKGRLSESAEEFKNALVMNPTFPPLYAGLGKVEAQMKKPQQALADIHEALRIDPNYGDAYEALGEVEMKQGHLKESIQAFEKAHILDPDNPSYLRSLLKAYERAGQYGKALTLYQELSAHPRSLLTLNF